MKSKITRSTWLSVRSIRKVREILRGCPDKDIRDEGLACLRNAAAGYLMNLIPMDHPNRVAAVLYIESNQEE
jgi:hypothetical protein